VDAGAYETTGCSDGTNGSGGGSGSGYGSTGSGSGANGSGNYVTPGAGGNPTEAGAATLATQGNNPEGAGISASNATHEAVLASVLKKLSSSPTAWILIIIAAAVFATLMGGRGGFWLGKHRKLLRNRYKKTRKRIHKTHIKLRRYFRNA
jgi:hypothetical protein